MTQLGMVYGKIKTGTKIIRHTQKYSVILKICMQVSTFGPSVHNIHTFSFENNTKGNSGPLGILIRGYSNNLTNILIYHIHMAVKRTGII